MQKENRPILKSELRKKLLALRSAIPKERLNEARNAIFEQVSCKGAVCSFYSIGSEIDLSLLNRRLAQSGRLIANRLEGEMLVPYRVLSEEHLVVSPLGFPEPDPLRCQKASLSEIALILVPGLGFDKEKYRIGYGKGYYDRFLATVKGTPTAGVGFREQLLDHLIPRDPWDIPVRELLLV